MMLIFPVKILLVSLAALLPIQSPAQVGRQIGASPRTLAGRCFYPGVSHAMSFVPGGNTTNTFVCSADPELRRFIVFVPSSYQPSLGPYPVVYMLHGTGQTAQIIKNNTTWNQAAETLGFIAVYPEALPYLLNDGTTRTKWHTLNVAQFTVDPSELPMADDVAYLRELQNTLAAHLNVDCERVFASGFSNGGGFVKSMARVHLADIFAATSSSGGLGLPTGIPTDFYPLDGVSFRPHFEIVGTRDANKKATCVAAGDINPGDDLPRLVADIVNTPCMWDPLTALAEAVGLDPGAYRSIEQPGFTQILWNTALHPGPGPTEFRFRILPNLGHEYPSGTNYPVDHVPIYYQWMTQYTR